METRKYIIGGLEDVRILFQIEMNVVSVIIEEKQKMRYFAKHGLTKKIENEDNFDFDNLIIEAMKGFTNKKLIEQSILNLLPETESVLQIPNLEVD